MAREDRLYFPASDRNHAVLKALAGGLVVALLAPQLYRAEPELFGPVHILLALAVLVVAPLAVALAATPDASGRHPWLYRLAIWVGPIAGASTAASFLFPAGRMAALLAAPWGLFAALTAAFGVLRFYRRRGARLQLAELCIDIGLVYLLLAARWLLLSRAGFQSPRVPQLIVALTAVHFHYTFFTATLLTGLLGKHLAAGGAAAVPRGLAAAALGVLAGPMLVAMGINADLPSMEVAGAVLLAASLFATAGLTALVAAPRAGGWPVRILLWTASAALGGAMILAAYFAIGKYCGFQTLSYQAMIRLHGIANATYAVCSLLGWHTAYPSGHSRL